ncbi:hypothetical protein O181_013540 [Austropuccinia psidii MF-1]|uniref:Uncharacterized protein n=1 Tax=Austropuccinia psidii MF-1 TaxID=1389203 RepID=A0A9Q3BZ76_9BASI|nr:hypothetical protein [Austropuccinia psidii MF-1]
MEHINHIDGLFIDVESIPDYWITASPNTPFKGHASIWYTEMNKIHGKRNWPWWRPFHLRMTNTQGTKIHIIGVSDSLKDLNPLILK